ncbi:hypothetical protein ACI6Q2_12095 [Chitinophagaceae bacterium LWZ2-11]
MIYSNDEFDKKLRQRNYYLKVFILPITAALIVCGLIYLAYDNNYIDRQNAIMGYFLSSNIFFYSFLFGKRNWLKMPDGSYYYVKGMASANIVNTKEPIEYEIEYHYSKKEKAGTILMGLLVIGVGIFIAVKGQKALIISFVAILFGAFFTYKGITELVDKTPRLKLAKEGLWTKKLGFIDWDNIIKTLIVEDKSGRTPTTILEIYVKGTVFAEANAPDERLNLNDIEGKEYVEMVIDSVIKKRNEAVS